MPRVEALPQRLTVDELADDERTRVEVAEIMDHEDIRMIERRRRMCLGMEPAETVGIGGDPWRQQLQRHWTIELRVVRLVDLAHAAGADPLDDAIAADAATDQVVGRAIDQDRGRCFEKVGRRDRARGGVPRRAAAGGRRCSQASARYAARRTRIQNDRGVEDRLDARPGGWRHGHRPDSCWYNQAFAHVQSRLTVAGETPRTVGRLLDRQPAEEAQARRCAPAVGPSRRGDRAPRRARRHRRVPLPRWPCRRAR